MGTDPAIAAGTSDCAAEGAVILWIAMTEPHTFGYGEPLGCALTHSGGAFAMVGCQRIRGRRRRDGFALLLPYCYERGALDQETNAGRAEPLTMSSRINGLVVGRVGIEPTTKRLRVS